MSTFTRYQSGSPLFVSSGQGGAALRSGYLLPAGASTPDSFGIADALQKYPGWFVMFQLDDPANVPAFAAAAQVFLANSANAGALVAWFTNANSFALGLAGWVVTAPRGAGTISITRPALVEFANFALSLPVGTTIAPSGDGNGLTFAQGTFVLSLSVTPFGTRQPVRMPLTSVATLAFLGAPATSGCTSFGLTLTKDIAAALDIGLRSFTAPSIGGYASSARYPVFDLTSLASGTPLAASIDPVTPLDPTRSMMTFAQAGTALPSTYRSAVGGNVTLTPNADASLVFCDRLLAVDKAGQPVPSGNRVFYLVPSGTFRTSLPAAKAKVAASGVADLTDTLMCGLSSTEYLAGPSSGVIAFVPGQAAFAPTLKDANPAKSISRTYGALTTAATTSWAYLASGATGSAYFAQPDSSVLHQSVGATYLVYLPLAVGAIPPAQPVAASGIPTAFPLMPYTAVSTNAGMTLADAAEMETQAWAPLRRGLVQQLIDSGKGSATPPATPDYGTTPQGLLLHFHTPDMAWAQMTLAVSPSAVPANRLSTLFLDSITDELKDALQTNQLFLVASSGDKLLADADINYSLTQERLNLLAAQGATADVVARLQPLVPTMWPSSQALDATLKVTLSDDEYKLEQRTHMIRDYLGDFSLFVADWEFDLSPWRWVDHRTVLIFKFCRKQLRSLVADTSQWAGGDTYNDSKNSTQQQIADIFADATQRLADGDTSLSYFVNTVMSNPDWNGILALNATVPLSGLPAQMEGIAAGIDVSRFQAHHLGISVTPITFSGSTPTAAQSSVFALIDYEDDVPLASQDDYQFKVNSLKVLIANSNIAQFSSRIELLVNALFGEVATQVDAPDNNLTLNGYYQQSGGVGSYAFLTKGPTAYRVTSSVLYQLVISSGAFVTATANAANPSDTTVHSYFNLTGALAFQPQTGFDFLSYGPEQAVIDDNGVGSGLRFTGLSIDMTFDQATPTYKTFTFDAARVVLDAASSQVRSQSLAAHFPMALKGLTQGLGQVTPDSLGFMPIDSPLQGSELSAPWFGLRYDLDLGSPGALAASAGLTAGLMLGWAPNPSGATVYVGLGLPGVTGGNRAISLEGILSLVFGNVLFQVQAPTYILQLSNIAIKLMSLTFPPNGQVSMLLFGNPDAQTSGALGWYACYVKNGAGGGGKGDSQKRLTLTESKREALPHP